MEVFYVLLGLLLMDKFGFGRTLVPAPAAPAAPAPVPTTPSAPATIEEPSSFDWEKILSEELGEEGEEMSLEDLESIFSEEWHV